MNIKFEVAPYALFDVLCALNNTRDSNRYVEYGVIKEDNNLIVWANEKYYKRCTYPETGCGSCEVPQEMKECRE